MEIRPYIVIDRWNSNLQLMQTDTYNRNTALSGNDCAANTWSPDNAKFCCGNNHMMSLKTQDDNMYRVNCSAPMCSDLPGISELPWMDDIGHDCQMYADLNLCVGWRFDCNWTQGPASKHSTVVSVGVV